VRRAIAVILTLVLANVNVARALPCDDVAPATAEASAHAPIEGSGHEHHGPASPAPAPAPDQDTAPAQCCQAMTSCVSIGDLAVEKQSTGAPIVTEVVSGDVLAAPLVRLTAPEPPPPKV
jgi:hypothetical protein